MPRLVTFDPQVRVEGLGHGDLMGLEQRGDEEAYDVQLRRQAIDLLRQRRAARLQLAAAAATNAADAAANKRQGTTTSPLSCTTHNPVAEEYDGAASTAQEAQAKTTADRRWRLLCAALCMGLLLLCVAGYFIAIELTAQKLSRNGACDFNLAESGVKRAPRACQGEEVNVFLVVSAPDRANEVTVRIDQGSTWGVPPNQLQDGDVLTESVCLDPGKHTVSYFDTHGDGWRCGYWEVQNAGGDTLVGGSDDGHVVGAGGQTEFVLAKDLHGGAVANVSASRTVVVTIVSKTGAKDMSWNIDGGGNFPGQATYSAYSRTPVPLMLPDGPHRIYVSTRGRGWHGGFWQITQNETVIAGGHTAGQVIGSGGEAMFCVTCCAPPCAAGNLSTTVQQPIGCTVQINAKDHASEMSWNIDNGPAFPTVKYLDGEVKRHTLLISPGTHSINCFDSYGDGWHSSTDGSYGYWTVIDAAGAVIAGGPQAGQVKGAGGQSKFCIGDDSCPKQLVASVPVTIEIVTKKFAGEITWKVDGGLEFGRNPPYQDDAKVREVLMLPAGTHTLYYFDADPHGISGWDGGYYTILDCSGTVLKGGPRAGLVKGAGGETKFTVTSCDPKGDEHVKLG